MDEESMKLLTINTHKGLYQFTRLPFGVASSPAIWQRTIDQILQGLEGVQCILYRRFSASDIDLLVSMSSMSL
jgi:hypothetical protein